MSGIEKIMLAALVILTMKFAIENIVITPVKQIQNKSKETFQNDQDHEKTKTVTKTRSSEKNKQNQWIHPDEKHEYSQKISNNLFVRVYCSESDMKRKNYR